MLCKLSLLIWLRKDANILIYHAIIYVKYCFQTCWISCLLSQTDVDNDDDPTMIFIEICDTLLSFHFPMIISLFVNVFIFENRCHTNVTFFPDGLSRVKLPSSRIKRRRNATSAKNVTYCLQIRFWSSSKRSPPRNLILSSKSRTQNRYYR